MAATLTVDEMNARLLGPAPAPGIGPETLSLDAMNARLGGMSPPASPAPTPPARHTTAGAMRARIGGLDTPAPPAIRGPVMRDEAADITPWRSALHAGVRSAADVLADIPRSIGIGQAQDADTLLDSFGRIDRGESLGFLGMAPFTIFPASGHSVGAYRRATPQQRAEIRAEVTRQRDARELPLYQAGEAASRYVEEALPTIPESEQGIGHTFARAGGSFAGFAAGGVTGRLVKLPALVSAGAMGAASGASVQFQDALASGAGLADAYEAAKLGALVGTTEGLPIARLLDRFDKATGGTIRKAIIEGVKGGVEEGGQELFQTLADNLIASDLVGYDPDRETFTGTGEGAGVGFTIGTLASVVAAMLGAKVRHRSTPEGPGESQDSQVTPSGPQEAPQQPPAPSADSQGAPVPPPQAPAGDKAITGVPMSQAALEGMLNRAAAKRNAERLTPEERGEAERLQLQALATLEDLEQQAQIAQQNGEKIGALEFTLETARGQQTRFALEPNPKAIAKLRKKLSGRLAAEKFHTEDIPETLTPAEMSARVQGAAPETLSPGEMNARLAESADGETLPATAAMAPPGANYRGMVRDVYDPATPSRATPIRRENILRPLATALGLPFYQGRIKSKSTLGFYRRRVREIRLKRMNDIEVAAHESAHALDDVIPELRRQWTPASNANAEVRAELRGVSYDQSKLYEGYAEFMRLWMTQTEEARTRAPKFFGWFEDFVARSEYGPALRQAQAGMTEWFDQSAVDRARSKIGVAEEINAGLTRRRDKFRQSIADDLHGIMQAERTLTGGLAPVGAYETARLVRGKHALIEGALIYGAPVVNPDGSHGFKGKGLQQILDPVADQLENALLYFVGRSASELLQQGREHLFTSAEVRGMLALETPEARAAFDEYQDWNRAVLDFAQRKGVINAFARSTWRRAQYLPFHRVGQPGAFSAVPGDWKGIKALTGGTDNIRDVLGNMIGNAAMLIDAGLTNEARQRTAELAQQQGGARFMAKIPAEDKLVKIHRAEVERAILEALGVRSFRALPVEMQMFVDQIINGMERMVPLVMHNQTPFGGNVVAVLDDGKPTYYEVADPILYRSLTHLNRPTRSALRRWLSIPKRLGTASITLTGDFLAANVARDTLMGWVMSQHGFKPILDSARGMVSRVRRDPAYRDFIANGGGFSSYLVDEDAFKTHMERFYRSKGIDARAVLDSPAKLLLALERIADAFEMSTRLGEYKRAIRRGEHPRHAAYSAREVSTDFAMRGDNQAIGYAYDTIIFLKAAMNGVDRLYRGLAHDPNKGAIAIKTAAIALVSVGLYALNRGNPLYDDLEDWEKDVFWHFYIPTPETIQAWAEGRELPPLNDRYEHFRYPKIWEIGAVASIAERSLAAFLDGQPEKLGADILRILRDTFRVEIIPQAVAPIIESFGNEIRFLERPIETEAMQARAPWARAGTGTSRTLAEAGEAMRGLPRELQASPAQVEALLRGYFNTWSAYGLTLTDAMFFDDVPDLALDQYPVVRRFYQSTPPRHTKWVTQLYEALDAANEARRTMRWMDETYRPEIASEIENSPANLEYRQLTRAGQSMRSFSAEMKRVATIPDLDTLHQYADDLAREKALRPKIGRIKLLKAWGHKGRLKRELLDMWIVERNALAKTVMQDIEAQHRAAEVR